MDQSAYEMVSVTFVVCEPRPAISPFTATVYVPTGVVARAPITRFIEPAFGFVPENEIEVPVGLPVTVYVIGAIAPVNTEPIANVPDEPRAMVNAVGVTDTLNPWADVGAVVVVVAPTANTLSANVALDETVFVPVTCVAVNVML